MDFEEALMNAVSEVFPKICIVGCLFHFVKQIQLKFGKYGLLTEEYLEDSNILLKELSKAPFTIYKNNNFITEIFGNKIKFAKDNNHINLLLKFKNYFINYWNRYFKNSILNYKNLKKEQSFNSYIQKYNKRIRGVLGKFIYLIIYNIAIFLNRKDMPIIQWPLFLSFIIEEESYYTNILLCSDNTFINKIDIINIKDNYIEEEKNENDEDINLNNIKIKNWLVYNNYCCRHTVFYLYIINYFINLNKFKISNNIKLLYELAVNLDQLKENEYNLGFWEI